MSYIFRPKKNTAWRNSVLKNLTSDLILHKKIITSLNIAKSLEKKIAKLITWAKINTLHTRRLSLAEISNKKQETVRVLFTELKEKYKERNGGYTSIKKSHYQRGDNALKVQISLV